MLNQAIIDKCSDTTALILEIEKKLVTASPIKIYGQDCHLKEEVEKGKNLKLTVNVIANRSNLNHIILKCGERAIASFYLGEFPNNCGLLTLSAVNLFAGFQNLKLSHDVLNLAKTIALKYGYSQLVGTTAPHNMRILSKLKKLGWEKINEFKNTRTHNKIEVWTWNLHKKPE